MSENLRNIQRLENNQWVTVRISDLRVGDTFRFVDDEMISEDQLFEARSEPYYVEDEQAMGIEATPIEQND